MASSSDVVGFRCFVRGLDRETDEDVLKEAFSKFGNVIGSKMRDGMTGTSRRCGFVTFEEEKSMRDAIKEMHGPKNTTGFVCYVHRLDPDTDAKRLAYAFCMFGEITDCQIAYHRGKSRGHGFVTFKDEGSMRNAVLMMDGHDIDGCQIRVEESHRNKGVSRFLSVVEAPPDRPHPAESFCPFGKLFKDFDPKDIFDKIK